MAGNERKVIVITGVSRGLGRAMVDRFIALGHTVAGCARSASAVEELSTIYGPPHMFGKVDVANDQAVAEWAREVIAALGPPDLLINNAALINRNARLWEVPPGEFEQLLRVNIGGIYITRSAILSPRCWGGNAGWSSILALTGEDLRRRRLARIVPPNSRSKDSRSR